MNKQILYYTCNTHPEDIEELCQEQLAYIGLPIVSVSLNKEIYFGHLRLTMHGERGVLMMHKQILEGLRVARAKYIFMCENDVLYHPSHFDFLPDRTDTFYYNTNVWRMRWEDKLAVWTDDLQQTSGICAARELLLDFYTRRVEQLEREGDNRHYEPQERYGCKTANWMSDEPNICIRHTSNLTKSKWTPEEYRNPRYAKGWRVSMEIWRQYGSIL